MTWEWFYDWAPAFDRYFPKYATGCVRSFFPVNVPYNIPTPLEWPCSKDQSCFRDSIQLYMDRLNSTGILTNFTCG